MEVGWWLKKKNRNWQWQSIYCSMHLRRRRKIEENVHYDTVCLACINGVGSYQEFALSNLWSIVDFSNLPFCQQEDNLMWGVTGERKTDSQMLSNGDWRISIVMRDRQVSSFFTYVSCYQADLSTLIFNGNIWPCTVLSSSCYFHSPHRHHVIGKTSYYIFSWRGCLAKTKASCEEQIVKGWQLTNAEVYRQT